MSDPDSPEAFAMGIVSTSVDVIAASGSSRDGLPWAWVFHLQGFVYDARGRAILHALPAEPLAAWRLLALVVSILSTGTDGANSLRTLPSAGCFGNTYQNAFEAR